MFQKAEVLTKTVKVNGAEIYHEVRGDGPPVLFIPGATGDAGAFEQVAGLLAGEFTVVTYDRRGNSRSPRPAGWERTSPDEQADDAAGLLQASGLAPALVYGGSSGAIIALNLLIRYPELVRGAILHEPPLLSILARPEAATSSIRPVIDREMSAGRPRRAVEAFLRFAIGAENFERMNADLRERILNNGETLFGVEFGAFETYRPADDTLASVQPPVQVMASQKSAPFFHEAALWLAGRLNVGLVPMPGGHSPQRDCPAEMVDAIRPFLRQASAEEAPS